MGDKKDLLTTNRKALTINLDEAKYGTFAEIGAGQEVARVGVFGHGADDGPILNEHHRGAWDLARRISMRLGHVPASALESTA